MKTIAIVALGNPGEEYMRTRHNAGFLFAEYFWHSFRDAFEFSEWEEKKKLKSLISIGKIKGGKIILAKPQTFMNLSGEAVRAVIKFYKAKLSDLVVVQDEIDLPLSKYKFSMNSSSAGHRGVQNVVDALGTQNFTRLRIGVDNRRDKKIPTEKYVLGKFTKKETDALKNILKLSAREIIHKIKL